jgi:hypothetical protein
MPQSVGWQFMGHMVRIVRWPLVVVFIGPQYTDPVTGP